MLSPKIQDLLIQHYLVLKVIHIVAFTAWMAGLFYLPRLFVYHAGVAPHSETARIFQTMERRLLKIIMNPSMIITFVAGALLSLIPGIIDWKGGWWHTKLFCVFLLAGFHGFLSQQVRRFGHNHYDYTEKVYRLMNEVPTVLLIIIVVCIVVR